MNPKVFISHASEDKERFVLNFAKKLRDNGVDAWLDKWEMLPGDSLVDKIFENGIKEATAFIVVISSNSYSKPWVKEELNAAFVKRVEGKVKLIPIVIDDCEVPECLKSTLYSRINPDANYDDQFNGIVLSVLGQTEKPPIGEIPAYMKAKGLEIPGLDKIDNKILYSLCEFAMNGDGVHIDQPQLKEIYKLLTISIEDFEDSLNILANKNYVETRAALGAGIFMVTISNQTIEKYLKSTVGDLSEIFKKISLCVLNEGITKNVFISDRTNLSINLVNFALDQLNRKKLITARKFLGGHYEVLSVSPELKRMYR